MNIRIFTLTLEPANPVTFSIENLRSFLNRNLLEYSALSPDREGFVHRYPAVQCKQVKDTLMAVGIAQGADFLQQLSSGMTVIAEGPEACTVTGRDPAVREEFFGIAAEPATYEFQTSYLALNQQNARKFYDLKGKPERDAFLQKILAGNLSSLAKSLDCPLASPLTCEPKVRFRRERIERENIMVFYGKFRTNLSIPDYLGIGQSLSLGYGTVRRLEPEPGAGGDS
ncbi:CRISPR-associated endonuclease Cas6 [uncultured Methanoregula sp.]|uniref:CRISPR-associated endonuclease Cas6 n=1 Tax=uncultured Methanoregula sp. TaxID=1005933 RepID=UPI002AABEAD3|nr:CRISPR-associated endonuclease Cas6 [uncultured Methanoregula sp.]